MPNPTTNPCRPNNDTHPMRLPLDHPSGLSGLGDRGLARLAAGVVGAVPARVEMRWPIVDKEAGTRSLMDEGRRRLLALGDLHGFTVITEHWDFEDVLVLQVVAGVLWFPSGPVERRVLDDDPLRAGLLELAVSA